MDNVLFMKPKSLVHYLTINDNYYKSIKMLLPIFVVLLKQRINHYLHFIKTPLIMKKSIYILSTALIIMVSMISMISSTTHAGGSPGGYTGSSADGKTCTTCHSGTAIPVNSWITTNIPASGYVPGATYTITITGTHSGVARFGFEMTAENSQNNKVGSFTITNTTKTKLVSSTQVTHTGNGLTPTNDSNTWSVDWTAPAGSTGDVTFYAALNAANGNMGTSGDVIYTTSTVVTEGSSIGVENISANQDIKLFPSTVDNTFNLKWNTVKIQQLAIYNISGKLVKKMSLENSQNSKSVDVSQLAKGSYFVYLQVNDEVVVKRFIKK